MRALSIRQPYAELTLRGIKPIEFWFDRLTAGRSRSTKLVGDRSYIYASQQWASGKLFLEDCRVKPEIRIKSQFRNPNDETGGRFDPKFRRSGFALRHITALDSLH